jgi:hypothetical protein
VLISFWENCTTNALKCVCQNTNPRNCAICCRTAL